MYQLVDEFYAHRDPSFAAWQEAYMRHQFAFIGLRKSMQKKLQARHLKKLEKEETLVLWKMKEREFQYSAMDLFLCHEMHQDDLSTLEIMIDTKSWWDTVDIIASNHCGKYFQKFGQMIPTTLRWIQSTNPWMRRAALLFQIRYKEKTNRAMLFEYCLALANDTDPFIQRAIGWALREYGKCHPSAIEQFIQKEHSKFSRLSIREASYLLPSYQGINECL